MRPPSAIRTPVPVLTGKVRSRVDPIAFSLKWGWWPSFGELMQNSPLFPHGIDKPSDEGTGSILWLLLRVRNNMPPLASLCRAAFVLSERKRVQIDSFSF